MMPRAGGRRPAGGAGDVDPRAGGAGDGRRRLPANYLDALGVAGSRGLAGQTSLADGKRIAGETVTGGLVTLSQVK